MKKVLRILLLSIILALLSSGAGLVVNLNLVWVVAAALFVVGFEMSAVVIAVLSGFLFDVMMGANVGITGLSIILGLGVFALINSLGLITSNAQKFISVMVVFFLAGIVNSFVKYVLGEFSIFNWMVIGNVFQEKLFGALLSGIVLLLIESWKDRNQDKNVIKL
jgi:hypothetical protein